MRRLVPIVLALAAVAALPASAVAQSGPALSVPANELAQALECPQPLAGATRAPVLLVPGTNLEPDANFDWNYEPALTAAKIPWCAVTLPRYAMGDIQVSAEYVVAALRRMASEASRRVSVIGFSQGGMIGRWALRWWPDTRTLVEDLVGLAPSNHGTESASYLCQTQCPPAYWQQRDDSNFTRALNSEAETWVGIDYTVAYTHNDEVVTPNADAKTGSSALRTGAGRIRNTAVQDICPADPADHLILGSYDSVGWALAYDALTHDGPADPQRIDAGVCAQPFMPGVDAATFPADWARYSATVGQGAAASEYVAAEPPLKPYAQPAAASGGGGATATPARHARRCRFTLRLDRRLRHARVRIAGRRAKVRRRHGRLVATVSLKRGGRGKVKVRGTTRHGRRVVQTRRMAAFRA